jgi:c-di-GMP-binding flagellar brake protein YcgR
MRDSSIESDSISASQVDFESIRLQQGVPLQIQHSGNVSQKFSLKYIGAVKGKSIMASLPIADGKAIQLPLRQSYIIRGFQGKYAFAFTSHVIQVRSDPFPYVHFSYPNSLESKLVRKAFRVNVTLPASVIGKSDQAIPVSTIDLSAKGSMIASTQPIGDSGDSIKMQLDVAFEEVSASLIIPAKIRNASYSKDEANIHIGIEFENIPQNDMLILNNFILSTTTSTWKC